MLHSILQAFPNPLPIVPHVLISLLSKVLFLVLKKKENIALIRPTVHHQLDNQNHATCSSAVICQILISTILQQPNPGMKYNTNPRTAAGQLPLTLKTGTEFEIKNSGSVQLHSIQKYGGTAMFHSCLFPTVTKTVTSQQSNAFPVKNKSILGRIPGHEFATGNLGFNEAQ